MSNALPLFLGVLLTYFLVAAIARRYDARK